MELDRTQQRIIGVLIEKELTTPDVYPLTMNALVAGCNQKSNRDPEMALETFEIEGALFALRERDWIFRREGGRAPKHRHAIEDRLGLDNAQKAVIAELLLRGPQAPGALKPRVARMGYHATPDDIFALLESMAARVPPLVERLPRRPRERDQRWAHRLGPRDEEPAPALDSDTEHAPAPRPATAAPTAAPSTATPDLAERVARLEAEVGDLRARIEQLGQAGQAPADARP